VYHGDPLGDGVDHSGTSFQPAGAAWTSPSLDGQLYGEPLEATGRVFAATENDTVYALAADTGQVLWSTHLGTAVPSADLPCGNISPRVGITSTPVIDPARSEIFVVADEMVGGTATHVLVGLDLYSGQLELTQDVDPAGSDHTALLQRAALTLDDGQVVFGYGGNAGDCADYHGWVVAVPEVGGPLRTFEVDAAAGESQGAVWMGGAAAVVDGSGDLWLSTGNGSNASAGEPYDDSDGTLDLTPALAVRQFFAPTTWYQDNAQDLDLAAPPALLSDGLAVQVGKSRTLYLLDRSHLGGVGGQLATATRPAACDNLDGGVAFQGTTVYVGCLSGVVQLEAQAQPAALGVGWTGAGGGPPIVAGGLVWSIGGGDLDALDPASGATVQQFPLGAEANDFPTPSVGDGLLLAPSATAVHAFAGPAGLPGPPAPPPTTTPGYWLVRSQGQVSALGGAPDDGSAPGPLSAPVVALAASPGALGYRLAGADGGVFCFGGAPYEGSMGGRPLNQPVVGMAATPDGRGYWLVARDGGIFSFGDAPYEGSMGGRPLNQPIVGMAATPDGRGYLLVARDGGVFAFGDARYAGSMGGTPLRAPVVGLALDPATGGYWLAGADGGVFSFDAPFEGSAGALALGAPVVAVASTPDGGGYRLAGADGGVFCFGDAAYRGGAAAGPPGDPVVALATFP
jgi:outer membrane protein assembly factor BamB